MQIRILTALAAAIGLGMIGCGTDDEPKKNSLDFGSNSSALVVGQTSALWTASKTTIDANGKTNKTDPYASFHLVSSDTTVAAVRLERQLEGKKPGESKITGYDNKSSLVTQEAITVTVTAAP
ncbi:MAG: hypothetical protein ABIW76_10920 [Fibrobacteria bacterium]